MQKRGIPTIVWLTPILPYINNTEENVTGIIDKCIELGVKGIIGYDFGLTLRDGDREYYYEALDKHFPGLKQKYIKEYGNAYHIESPNGKELRKLFRDKCKEAGLLMDNQCFEYMNEYPEKYEQLSIFNI